MLSETEIVSMIMRAAASWGDPAPTAIGYVYGTRGNLTRVVSRAPLDDADSATPAVLVEATGNFIWYHRAPIAAPNYNYTSGTAITLVIDERTGLKIGRGISPEPHDLSSLGQVHHPAVPTDSN